MTPPSPLQSLYQELILDHHAHPRGAGPLEGATHEARRDNPLCGDRITLRLRLERGDSVNQAGDPSTPPRIVAARFEADGCALSIASASLLTTRVVDGTPEEALALRAAVAQLLARGPEHELADRALLGDLVALEGTRQFPARIRCALLPWDALALALAPR